MEEIKVSSPYLRNTNTRYRNSTIETHSTDTYGIFAELPECTESIEKNNYSLTNEDPRTINCNSTSGISIRI